MAPSIKQILSYPPHVLAQKAISHFKQAWKNRQERPHYCLKEHRHPTENNPVFSSYFSKPPAYCQSIDRSTAEYLLNMYRDHRFDLLGSGWVTIDYFTPSPGLEDAIIHGELGAFELDEEGNWLERVVNREHLDVSQQYWNIIRTLQPDYSPIDWQRDFKSGYRWSAKVWGKDSRKHSDFVLGADLKCPWELSRLQHLPKMAAFAHQFPDLAEAAHLEFQCQLLDFFMANPPSMGVNNNCAMDMGIRAANILLAYDLFSNLPKSLPFHPEFKAILYQNLLVLGKTILEDVEYREGLTSNHYLGNVAGMAWLGAYLPQNESVHAWLVFAGDALVVEMQRQFFNDGGNFEGSTSYHRLSAEMMAWSAYIMDALPADKKKSLKNPVKYWPYPVPISRKGAQHLHPHLPHIFPAPFYERLQRARQMSVDMQHANGQIAQFGDNDSGRFVHLLPIGQLISGKEAQQKYLHLQNYFSHYSTEEAFWDEDSLRHDEFTAWVPEGTYAAFQPTLTPSIPPFDSEQKTVILAEFDEKTAVSLVCYPHFGLYGWKNDRISLFVSAIHNRDGQHFHWGHVHNDKLSFELFVDGKPIIQDGGTYLYTPLPHRRNEFRSVLAHHGIVVDEAEPNSWEAGKRGLFRMEKETKLQILEISEQVLSFYLEYRNVKWKRTFFWENGVLKLKDEANMPFNYPQFEFYSSGYGKREPKLSQNLL